MLKLAFKNRIRHNLIRCIALLLLSLIGVCVVAAGISFPSTARDTVNSYLNETNFWDVHVGSTLGFNAEDVSAVSAVSGVTKVMPVLSTKTSVSVNNSGNYKAYIATTDFKTLSLSSSGFISALTLSEGSFPLNSTGCVVVKSGALKNNVLVGDQIRLTVANDDLTETVFTVTGIATSPSMMSDKGNIAYPDAQLAIYINDGAFKDKTTYSEMFVRVEGSDNRNAFKNNVNKTITLVKEEIAKIAASLEFKRTEELSGEYQKNVDKAQKQYDYIKEDSEKKLSEINETVKKAGERIAAEQKNVDAKQVEVDALKKEFENDTESIEELRKKENLTSDEKAKIQNYDKKVAAFNVAEGELNSIKSTLELNNATYESLKKEYDILKNLSDQKLKDAENKLNAAKNNEQITDSQIWKISDITLDEGFISLKRGITSASIMLCTVSLLMFAVIVTFIVLLVYNTVIKQDKDLDVFVKQGFLINDIKKIDFLICILGVLIGGILGLVIGNSLLKRVVLTVFSSNYALPEIKFGFPHYSGFVALLLLVAATVFVIYRTPHINKESVHKLYIESVEWINKHLNIGGKMILRNTFGDIKSLLFNITVTAVIVALITTAFSSGIAINSVTNRQKNIQKYNLTAGVTIPNYNDSEALTECLNNKEIINNYTAVSAKKLTLDNGKNIVVNVYAVTESESLRQVLNLKGDKVNVIAPDSVIIGENTAKQNKIKIGDDLTLQTANGTVTLKVTGICKNYIDNYVYIGNAVYETYFAAEGFLPMLLIDSSITLNAISELLTSGAVNEVNRILDSNSSAPQLDVTLKAIIILGITVLVLFLVGFNFMLIICSTNKREKELKALKLNGKSILINIGYVFSDLLLKNILGTVLGVLFGFIMFILVLVAINTNTVMYSSLIEWKAIILSAVISVMSVCIAISLKLGFDLLNKKTVV